MHRWKAHHRSRRTRRRIARMDTMATAIMSKNPIVASIIYGKLPTMVPTSCQTPCSGGLGVGQGEQHDVCRDQGNRPRGQPPVPAQQAVLAQDPLDDRDPGHQHHHDEGQVGAGQAGEAAEENAPPRPVRSTVTRSPSSPT